MNHSISCVCWQSASIEASFSAVKLEMVSFPVTVDSSTLLYLACVLTGGSVLALLCTWWSGGRTSSASVCTFSVGRPPSTQYGYMVRDGVWCMVEKLCLMMC